MSNMVRVYPASYTVHAVSYHAGLIVSCELLCILVLVYPPSYCVCCVMPLLAQHYHAH